MFVGALINLPPFIDKYVVSHSSAQLSDLEKFSEECVVKEEVEVKEEDEFFEEVCGSY